MTRAGDATVRPGHKNSAADTEVSCGFLFASRSLLTLFIAILAATPWTEGYRLLDNFPRGQDSELNVLALVAFLALFLLLTRVSRRALRARVALIQALVPICPPSISTMQLGDALPLGAALAASPPLLFTLPLLT